MNFYLTNNFFHLRYVTIQRGPPAGGSRGGIDPQVGSNLIKRDFSQTSLDKSGQDQTRTVAPRSRGAIFRERLLRQPRERIAALRERRSRRSPSAGVSIVYPSPSIESLLDPILENDNDNLILPALPLKSDVAYVFPQTSVRCTCIS